MLQCLGIEYEMRNILRFEVIVTVYLFCNRLLLTFSTAKNHIKYYGFSYS